MTKKAKAKSKRTEKKATTTATTTTATTTTTTTTKLAANTSQVDLAEVRKDISNIVGSNAAAMAKAVVEETLKGQLAPMKYLFEVSGLYPASESSEAKRDPESLAHTLMRKMNLPEIPIPSEDDDDVAAGSSIPAAPRAVIVERAGENADSGIDSCGKDSDGQPVSVGVRAEAIP